MAAVPLLRFPARIAAFIAILATAVPAAAQEHGAHEHGVGRLNLAIDGGAVETELMAPGADIVGFEHEPRTPEQKKAVEAAVATLKDGAKLFRFPSAAKCRQESAEVESPLIKEHGHGDESHAEFHARYRFRCDTPERLTHADVLFFEAFPSALELEVRTVTAKGQSARELTARRPRLHF